MKNKEHFKRSMVSSEVRRLGPKFLHKSERGKKFHQTQENVFHSSPQVISDPSPMSMSKVELYNQVA